MSGLPGLYMSIPFAVCRNRSAVCASTVDAQLPHCIVRHAASSAQSVLSLFHIHRTLPFVDSSSFQIQEYSHVAGHTLSVEKA